MAEPERQAKERELVRLDAGGQPDDQYEGHNEYDHQQGTDGQHRPQPSGVNLEEINDWLEDQRLAGARWLCEHRDGTKHFLPMVPADEYPWCRDNGYLDWRPNGYKLILPDGTEPVDQPPLARVDLTHGEHQGQRQEGFELAVSEEAADR